MVIVIAVAVPLRHYVERNRDERVAIDAIERLRAAQTRFHARTSGYATELASLTTACDGAPELASEVLDDLDRAGYALQVRAATSAALVGHDCGGRALTDDYYVAAQPRDPSRPGHQAFAARARGELFLFYDGIAPRETEMTSGLATPVAQRETFTIP